MANQRFKALFFIFLLLSANAYRLETASGSDAELGANHTAGQQPMTLTYAYSFASTPSSQSYAFARTQIQMTGGGGFYASSATPLAGATTVPGLYGTQRLNPRFYKPHVPTSLMPSWPVLLAAGVVLMGGLYLYHQHRMSGPIEPLFCPVSNWESDPAGLLVGSAAGEAFGEQISTFLSEDNNRGMPKCHGLRRHRLRADCDGDVDCKRQACRQMCCDRQDCTFFQFNTIDRIDNCWLGSSSRLSSGTCEQPFFGETCTTCRDRRGESWPQIHEDNMKCHSSLLGTGFPVENQYECQAHAVEQGHEFYQYDSERQKCETEQSCDSPSSHTMHDWKIFSSQNMPPPLPAAAQPSPDQEVWQFEPFLFHENHDMTAVQLTSLERCNAGDVSCMRDACRTKCLQHDWCIHYQFENLGDTCMLGATHVIDEDDVGMWFGGILAHDRQCADDEFKCPSSHECVQTCGGTCAGHSRQGPEGWCVRSAVENIVDDGHWGDNYMQHPIDAWCRGLERAVVTVSQGLGAGQSGADICRAACSADSQCSLWQMYPIDADNTNLHDGDRVRCWLGKEDRVGNPRFSCNGRSPKRWRLLAAPRAEAVGTRGCQAGKVACVISQQCLEICQDSCPGFDVTDAEEGLCRTSSTPRHLSEGARMDLALAHNLPASVPNPEFSMLASEGDLFTMSLNLPNLINPDTFEGDVTALCDVVPGAECELIDGACVCVFDEDVDCAHLFGHSERITPILAQEGMLLLSAEGCSCSDQTCTLRLLNSVPPVRTTEETTAAVQLVSRETEVCEESVVCPNMDRCEPTTYGAFGCGYNCDNAEGSFWCSHQCACNQQEAVHECVTGVMCPDMHSCDPISYGEYGCGYGCMRDTTYYFCSDDCTVCNQ